MAIEKIKYSVLKIKVEDTYVFFRTFENGKTEVSFDDGKCWININIVHLSLCEFINENPFTLSKNEEK